jgi:c-di-GMP-related signal transduction protein
VSSTGNSAAAKAPNLRFVARQPIFDTKEKVFGYELLFRDGFENYCNADDPKAAARQTLDSSLLVGLDILCDGRRAFINCTRDVLLKGHVTLLPSSQTVVEILETVPPDDAVISACRQLKETGYLLALDDFVADDPREPLTDMADILKVDVRLTTLQQRAAMVKKYGPWRCRLLAEKVETREEFLAAKNQGFLYFQGYFFRQPEVMSTHEIPAGQMNYVRMLQEVSKEELDLQAIERIIKSETSLCYRLLRYLNSALFAFNSQIRSVRHALALMGEKEIRRWVRLIATVGAAQQKSSELVLSTLVRSRFCELLSPLVPHGNSDLFLMGLLSQMDAILEVPMSSIMDKVPVDPDIKSTLLGHATRLRPLYQLMLAQESGEWEESATLAKQLKLGETMVSQRYWEAMRWAREVSSGA